MSNSTYRKNHNVSGNFDNLTLSDVSVAGEVSSKFYSGKLSEYNRLHQAIAYAPSSFATQVTGIASACFLNNTPASAKATLSTESQLYLLPAGARIVRAVLTNNGTPIAGATSFDVGAATFAATPTVTAAGFASQVLLAVVNTGVLIGAVNATFGGSAAIGTACMFPAITQSTTGIMVTNQGASAANTAGDLALWLEYLL